MRGWGRGRMEIGCCMWEYGGNGWFNKELVGEVVFVMEDIWVCLKSYRKDLFIREKNV